MGELRATDLETVGRQLGREPTTAFSVVARCVGGHPLVIRNHPRDANGDPFPTLFWLTCPEAVAAVSRLESAGTIGDLNARVETDAGFAAAVETAHREYARARARLMPEAEEWGGVGGTRKGVKCLHAHYANHLAGGSDPVGEMVAAQVEPVHGSEPSGRGAAVDLGTNAIRLLVVEADGTELARDMVITRIGRGVDRTGRIDTEALAGTLAVLQRYCRRARALHAERIRVSATSAVRDASNREELAAAVLANSGAELRILSGEEEGCLSFKGAVAGLRALTPLLVLDIGGGSTEFVVGSSEPEFSVSTCLGSVRLTERFVHSDPPSESELTQMRVAIAEVLDEVERTVVASGAKTLVAVAGTPTTLQAVSLELERYDPDRIHRTQLTVEEAERMLARLATMTNPERAAIPVMVPGRGDVIVAGTLVLVSVMRRWGFDRALVSERDILDGLAAELLETPVD